MVLEYIWRKLCNQKMAVDTVYTSRCTTLVLHKYRVQLKMYPHKNR